MDLATLSSAAQLLSSATAPSGTINSVRLTFTNSVTLDPSNGGAATTATLDPTAPNVRLANNEATVTISALTAVASGRLSNLVLDFKLSAFELVNGKLRPSIAPCSPTTFQGDSKIAHVSGTVASLTAGTGFTLDLPKFPNGVQATVAVTMSSSTVIANGAGATGSTATLANGDSVVVDGTVNATTVAVTAQSVLIVPAVTYPPTPEPMPMASPTPSPTATPSATPAPVASPTASPSATPTPRPGPEVSAIGSVGVVTASSDSFTLQVRFGDRFPGPFGGLTVVTSSGTVFQNGNATGTFANVTAGARVAVVGTLDVETATVTAQKVILLPSGS